MSHPPRPAEVSDLELSIVRNDLPFRVQRAIGLIPAAGLGVGRRALLLALVSWLPIALWAFASGRALRGSLDEPMLQHFGVTVRCLVAIPLLVLAEATAHARTARLLPYFVRSGLVTEAALPRFREIVRGVARLRDATLPWVAIAVILLAWTVLDPGASRSHELRWAEGAPGQGAHFGFGGWWFLAVAVPLFLALLLAWLWRAVLLCVLLGRIARLDLAIVATHPDRTGGLGFLEELPSAFGLVVLALSAVVASGWAHDVVFHGVTVQSLAPLMGLFVAIVLLVFLAPLLVFAPRLAAARRGALLDYGALVGEHGRRVRRRWIEGESVPDDGLLAAPELGPVADTAVLYDAVRGMRTLPIGKRALVSLALPAALPLIVVLSLQVPLKTLLLTLLKALA
jgi:hypothetical protein